MRTYRKPTPNERALAEIATEIATAMHSSRKYWKGKSTQEVAEWAAGMWFSRYSDGLKLALSN